jgi:hypothetical protein
MAENLTGIIERVTLLRCTPPHTTLGIEKYLGSGCSDARITSGILLAFALPLDTLQPDCGASLPPT